MRSHAERGDELDTDMIVPTLRVGMPPGTLRVPSVSTRLESRAVVTRSVTGCVPTRSVGTSSTTQNTDHPIRSLNNSSAFIPASEFPAAFNSGDHTHTVNCPGTTATIPPPTPLLPGKPTR